MKRLLSFLLALSVVAGLLTGITLTASAEEGAIDAIHVTGVTAPAVDALPTTAGIVVAPSEGITYTAKWQVFNNEINWYNDMTEGQAFASGNMYRLYMEINMGENNCNEDSIRFDSTLNGESLAPYGAGYDSEANIVYVTKEFSVGMTMIDAVVIDGLPEMVAGASTAADGIILPEGVNYAVSEIEWYQIAEQGGDARYEGQTLEDGYRYILHVYLKANAGCWFQQNNPKAPMDADGSWSDGNMAYMCFVYDLRPMVDQVEITGVPELKFGEVFSAADIKAPADANYTVEAAWQVWSQSEGFQTVESGTFEYNKEYELQITVTPNEGYSISENVSITVNGIEAEKEYDCWSNGDVLRINRSFRITPENGYVEWIGFEELPEAVVDADMTVPTLTLQEDTAVITDIAWVDQAYNPASGKFKNGKTYYLAVQLQIAREGMAFDEYLRVDTNSNRSATYVLNADGTVTVYIRYAFLAGIDAVDVAVTEPVIGAAPAAPQINSRSYTVEEYFWNQFNAESDQPIAQFEDGKRYMLVVTLDAADGYEFNRKTKITVNGKEAEQYDWTEEKLVIYLSYSFMEQLDRVEVTVPAPVLGQTYDYESIQLGGQNYQINYAEFYNTKNYEVLQGAFEKSKYALYLSVGAGEGYEFSEDCQLFVNGTEVKEFNCDSFYVYIELPYTFLEQIDRIDVTMPEPALGQTPDLTKLQITTQGVTLLNSNLRSWTTGEELTGAFEKDRYTLTLTVEPAEGFEFADGCKIYLNGVQIKDAWVDDFYADIYAEYSFRELVSKVDLPAFPALKVGDTLTAGQITAPDGAKYSLEVMWLVYDGQGGFDKFEGQIEAGKAYYMALDVIPKAGYEFAETTVMAVDNTELKSGMMIVETDYAGVIKLYSFGLEVIDTIDLTVPAPEEGKKPGKPSASEDAHFSVKEWDWAGSGTAYINDGQYMGEKDVFELDHYYWINMYMEAEEGYIFADDVKVTINGKQIEWNMRTANFIGGVGQVAGELGQLKTPAVDEEDPKPPVEDENPKTGETASVAMMASLLVLSAAAVVAIVPKKKYI